MDVGAEVMLAEPPPSLENNKMSYLALARKYRPQNFSEVTGHELVIKALQNSIESQRLHHAYLLTGTRGIGKTTLARIIAKAINCLQRKQSEPCNQCDHCVAITQGRFNDVLEIDAASKTKVEDTREILSNVLYAPIQGRYKVYIIDEVHMLSGHSFNALLKTLEEPPAHVVFILATTEPKQLPVTILSRCQQFQLHPLAENTIKKQLEWVIQQQQLKAEATAVELLSHAAQGSMRDALSLLDQALASTTDILTADIMTKMLGSVTQQTLVELLQFVVNAKTSDALAWVTKCAHNAVDFSQLTDDLLYLLHQIAIAHALPETISNSSVQDLVEKISPEQAQLYYEICLLNKQQLAFASSMQQGFEMLVIRLILFQPAAPNVEEVSNQTNEPAQALSTKTTNQANEPTQVSSIKATNQANKLEYAPSTKATNQMAEQVQAPSTKSPLSELDHYWEQVIQQLKMTGVSKNLLNYCTLAERTDKNWLISIDPSHATVFSESQQEKIRTALFATIVNDTVKIVFRVSDTAVNCPANLQQARDAARLDRARKNIEQNPNIAAIKNRFSATIDDSSIEIV